MASSLARAQIVPRRSAARGHNDHGWLKTFFTFSFAGYYDARYTSFGSLRVLNEDVVQAGTGFPTHPHRHAEIFTYVLRGELTHRDSMIRKGAEGAQSDLFYRMKRGDVQFTTGGSGMYSSMSRDEEIPCANIFTGIAHSEQNESDKDVHILQIWALPWTKGLTPRYHTRSFDEDAKRRGFLTILSPLKAGVGASEAEEEAAEPAIPATIPIHADLVMGAGIIGVGKTFDWTVGGDADAPAVRSTTDRKVYVHVPMCKGGKARIKLDGREESILNEGDGAFVTKVNAGDVLTFESVGSEEAEVVVLDSD